jgi:hypothetical protein
MPTWSPRAGLDAGPWARLSIWSRERNLTEAVVTGEDRLIDSIEVPLLPIAAWFVRNARAILHEEFPSAVRFDSILHEALDDWNSADAPDEDAAEAFEDARYEWYTRHFIRAGAEGAMLPNLAFARIDGRLFISWDRPVFAGARRIEFTSPSGRHHHAWVSAWGVLCEFVRYVAARSRELGVTGVPWINSEDPLAEASDATAADYLQFIAPEGAELLNRLGIPGSTNPESEPALLALRDLALGQDRDSLCWALSYLDEATGTPSPQLKQWRTAFLACSYPTRPESAGYDAATSLRRALQLNGQPLGTQELQELLARLAEVEKIPAQSPANDSVVGFREASRARVVLFEHTRTSRPWALRMELARALGHLLLDGATRKGALGTGSSRVARGPRRKRSGAFAAELLLPADGVRKLIGGRPPSSPEVFEELLAHFGVGARTAAWHLWNQRLLQSEEERDGLIEDFGCALPG